MAGRAKPGDVPPFVAKLYELVDDPSTDAIIHWYKNESSRDASKSGEEESDAPDAHGPEENGFVVERFEDFTTELLPRLSKSTSFCSFVRQLNGYGFSKSDPKRAAFTHNLFRRGKPHLLAKIKRRQSAKRRAARAQREAAAKAAERKQEGTTLAGDSVMGAVPAGRRRLRARVSQHRSKPEDGDGDGPMGTNAHRQQSQQFKRDAAAAWAAQSQARFQSAMLRDALATLKAVSLTLRPEGDEVSAAAVSLIEDFVQRQLPGVYVGVKADPHISVALDHMQSLVSAAANLATKPAVVSSGGSESGGGSPTSVDPLPASPQAALLAPKVEQQAGALPVPLAPGVVAPPSRAHDIDLTPVDAYDFSLPASAVADSGVAYTAGDDAPSNGDEGVDDADWAELVSVLS